MSRAREKPGAALKECAAGSESRRPLRPWDAAIDTVESIQLNRRPIAADS